jgi:tetratricopeptide (TPR) repeat protein
MRLGALYEKTEKWAEAEKVYRHYFLKNPDKLAGTRVLVGFLYRVDRTEDADRLLQALLAMKEYRAGAYALFGDLLAERNPKQAENSFRSAVREDPGDPRWHLALANFLAGQRRWSEAADAMDELLKLRPDTPGGQKQLVRWLIEAKQLDRAGGLIDGMIEKNSGDAEALVLKAMLAVARNDPAAAEGLLDRAIQISPDYAEAYANRSRLSLSRGELDRAKADLTTAYRLSGLPGIGMELARVHVITGEFDAAEQVLREILAQRQDYVPALHQLCNLYLYQQKWVLLDPLLAQSQKRFPKEMLYRQMETEMALRRGDGAAREAGAAGCRRQ